MLIVDINDLEMVEKVKELLRVEIGLKIDSKLEEGATDDEIKEYFEKGLKDYVTICESVLEEVFAE